jgi:glycosyltransferase involved in cell wall biosynthesis
VVVRPGDNEALAKAIVNLKENSELARVMGENGRKHVESEASIEAIGFKMKSILEFKQSLS